MTPEKLRNLRQQREWTQHDLAQRLAVSATTISKWELGNTPIPTNSLTALARVFGLTPNDWPLLPCCQAPQPCSRGLAAVKGSDGWSAQCWCTGDGACGQFAPVPQAPIKRPSPGVFVVAAFRLEELSPLCLDSLFDFLPTVRGHELNVLHSWLNHFTVRQAPWLVTKTGRTYTMWIRRGE